MNAASALKGPGGKECFRTEAKNKDKVTGAYSPLKGGSVSLQGIETAFEDLSFHRGVNFGFVFLRQGLL